MNDRPSLTAHFEGSELSLVATGRWTAINADALEKLVAAAAQNISKAAAATIDMHDVNALDTFGAWLLERLIRSGPPSAKPLAVVGLREEFGDLVQNMHRVNRAQTKPKKPRPFDFLKTMARRIAEEGRDLLSFVALLGSIGAVAVRLIGKPRNFRFTSTVSQLDRVGWQALPIVLLITFLIGSIIAQQGFFHFKKFGAENYVVDMVGILILREIGVLLVTIMVAGRSGSSYTAELGSMKMREEIDALRTMGLDPVEVLILPRVLALVLAVPILTFLGSMAALFGGGLVAWLYDGMSPLIFIARLREAVDVTQFKVGMVKAPFMALVIGVVACSEGLQVKGSAESLGLQTTTSVVRSIFLVIVLDGLFAIFFSAIGM